MSKAAESVSSPTSIRPVAFVTGASGGIGRAIALEFASTHNLVLADMDEAGLLEVVSWAESKGSRSVWAKVDVSDQSQLEKLVATSNAELGAISSVIACAGVEDLGTVETTSSKSWQRVMSVNLFGTFLTAKVCLPDLFKTRGTFTAVASDAGEVGAQNMSAYVASKHGVVGLVKSMALDFGPAGVRSNTICPGMVKTPMLARFLDEAPEGTEEFFKDSSPLGRFAEPEEIARVARHLSESGYANGMSYVVDGGGTAGSFSAADDRTRNSR